MNETKSWMILKHGNKLPQAQTIFKETNINFTIEGKRHLRAALGSKNFRDEYAAGKVSDSCDELRRLSKIAKSQPQTAYTAFIHRQQGKFHYFMRTIPKIHERMLKVDEKIENVLLPSLLVEEVTNSEKLLYSLPVRMGGLGISNFSEKCNHDHDASKKVSKPLTNLITQQSEKLPSSIETLELRAEVQKSKNDYLNNLLHETENTLMPEQYRAVQKAKLANS